VNSADFFVLGGCLLGFFAIMAAHEARAISRDSQAKERHDLAMKGINDARAVFLGARHEADRTSAVVDDLKVKTRDIDARVTVLELWKEGR
jgi:hypothetical protein